MFQSAAKNLADDGTFDVEVSIDTTSATYFAIVVGIAIIIGLVAGGTIFSRFAK